MYLLSFFREIFNQTFLWYIPTTCAQYMFANRINTTTALSCPDTQWFQLLDLHDLLKYNFVATKYCPFSSIVRLTSKFRRYMYGLILIMINFIQFGNIRAQSTSVRHLQNQLLFVQPVFTNIFIFVCTTNTLLLPFQFFLAFSIWGLVCIAVVFHYITYWYTKGLECRGV